MTRQTNARGEVIELIEGALPPDVYAGFRHEVAGRIFDALVEAGVIDAPARPRGWYWVRIGGKDSTAVPSIAWWSGNEWRVAGEPWDITNLTVLSDTLEPPP